MMGGAEQDDETIRADLVFLVTGRRLAFAACFALAIPLGLLGYWITGSDIGAIVGMAICLVLGLITGMTLFLTQCPKCRNLLFLNKGGSSHNMLISQCLTCGFSFSTWPSTGATDPTSSLRGSSAREVGPPAEQGNPASPDGHEAKEPNKNQMQRAAPGNVERRR